MDLAVTAILLLLVVPVSAGLVLMASRAIIVGAFNGDTEWAELLGAPLIGLPQLLWPLWGVALGLAALGYQRLRRIRDGGSLEPVDMQAAATP